MCGYSQNRAQNWHIAHKYISTSTDRPVKIIRGPCPNHLGAHSRYRNQPLFHQQFSNPILNRVGEFAKPVYLSHILLPIFPTTSKFGMTETRRARRLALENIIYVWCMYIFTIYLYTAMLSCTTRRVVGLCWRLTELIWRNIGLLWRIICLFWLIVGLFW